MENSNQPGGIAMALATQILDMVGNSGASQVEILAALGVVGSLVPTLQISVVTASDGEFLPES